MSLFCCYGINFRYCIYTYCTCTVQVHVHHANTYIHVQCTHAYTHTCKPTHTHKHTHVQCTLYTQKHTCKNTHHTHALMHTCKHTHAQSPQGTHGLTKTMSWNCCQQMKSTNTTKCTHNVQCTHTNAFRTNKKIHYYIRIHKHNRDILVYTHTPVGSANINTD